MPRLPGTAAAGLLAALERGLSIRSGSPGTMGPMIIPLILVLLPSLWLVVGMLVVAACRAASGADAR